MDGRDSCPPLLPADLHPNDRMMGRPVLPMNFSSTSIIMMTGLGGAQASVSRVGAMALPAGLRWCETTTAMHLLFVGSGRRCDDEGESI